MILNTIARRKKKKYNSYTERGKWNREWKEIMKAKIQWLKQDLKREIEAYIREHGVSNTEDTERGKGIE